MIWRKLEYLLPSRRRAAEQEMREELDSLAAMAGPGELGSLASASGAARATWHWTAFDGFWADFRYAVRTMAKQPGLVAVAVVSLGLGIGANTAIFSFADAILLRPLPVPRASEVLTINAATPDLPMDGLSYPEFRDLGARTRSFAGLTAFRSETLAVGTGPAAPPQARLAMFVSPRFFDVLRVVPLHGGLALPEREAAAVLAYDFWKSEFGADPAVMGRRIRLNGVDFQIAGVAPESFTGLDLLFRPAMYVPLGMRARLSGTATDPQEDRARRDLGVKGRLAPGVSASTARAEVANLGAALARAYPESGRNRQLVARSERAARLQQYAFRAVAVGSLAALAMFVLVIACANMANLLLARARARGREMAIRLAIGAGRLRLVRQLLVESLVLSGFGALAGLAVARAVMRLLGTAQVSSDVPIVLDMSLDTRLLLFNTAIALASCLLFGLSPAVHAARTDLASSLRSREGRAGGRGSLWGRHLSVAGQIALAVILLTAAGSYLTSSREVLTTARGFRTDHRISLEIDPIAARYGPDRAHELYGRLRERVRTLPGVLSVAFCESLPYSPAQTSVAVVPDGYRFPPGKEKDVILGGAVDERYFATMGVAILQGRAFLSGDRAGTRRVAIVNQEFARVYWPGRDAIGRRLRLDSAAGPEWEVVGVARTGHYQAPSEPPRPYVYFPFEQRQRPRMTLVVETGGEPADLAAPLRETVHSLDPDLPVLNLRSLAAHEARTVGNWFLFVDVLTGLGAAGLVLALAGLYGLVSYTVSRRTAEIGIRMALGASRAAVTGMVLRQGLAPALIGTAAGAILASLLAPRLIIGLDQRGTAQVLTKAAVPVLLLAACAAACYLPARRAARLDPARTLWQD